MEESGSIVRVRAPSSISVHIGLVSIDDIPHNSTLNSCLHT